MATLINARVRKRINGKDLNGTIITEEEWAWRVKFDDGQSEDWLEDEVSRGRQLWQDFDEKVARRNQRLRSPTKLFQDVQAFEYESKNNTDKRKGRKSRTLERHTFSRPSPSSHNKKRRKRIIDKPKRSTQEEEDCSADTFSQKSSHSDGERRDYEFDQNTEVEVVEVSSDFEEEVTRRNQRLRSPTKLFNCSKKSPHSNGERQEPKDDETTEFEVVEASSQKNHEVIFPYQNSQVAKVFNDTLHYGTITEVFADDSQSTEVGQSVNWIWHVLFDDGDEEGWNLMELHSGLQAFKSQPRRQNKGSPRKIKSVTNEIRRIKKNEEKQQSFDETEVEKFLKRKTISMGHGIEEVHYLIRWKDTWLPAEALNSRSRAEAFEIFAVDEEKDMRDNIIMLDDSSDDDTIEEINKERDVGTTGEEHPLIKVEVGSHLLSSDDENPEQESETDEDETVTGMVEVVVNKRTYRIGSSYYKKGRKDEIYKILAICPGSHSVKCLRYISSRIAFLRQGRRGREEFYDSGSKEIVLISDLTIPCQKSFPISDWKFNFDAKKGDISRQKYKSFSYFKETGKIQPSEPGKSKPRVLDLYAGAGGMSLGFQNAGMETMWAVDQNKAALDTLTVNFSNKEVFQEKVEDFIKSAKEGDPAYPGKDDVQHIHASPPCQGFSGKNRVGGMNAKKNNDETLRFLEAVKYYEPLTATYENVPALLFEKNRAYIDELISTLLEMNYQVRVEVLKASNFGDPQNRERVFLFAAKTHMCLPSAPQATHGDENGLLRQRTVKDAIGWIERNVPEGREFVKANRVRVENLAGYTPSHQQPEDHVLRADEPSRTVINSTSLRHYTGRCLTVRELACLQSFPWDFRFSGNMNEMYQQIGNAVPVRMATQVARSVAQVYNLP